MPRGSVYTPDEMIVRTAFSNARARAKYRNEPWELTYDEYVFAWGDDFNNRGKQPSSKCLVRNDETLPWRLDNVLTVDRSEMLIHQKQKSPRPVYR